MERHDLGSLQLLLLSANTPQSPRVVLHQPLLESPLHVQVHGLDADPPLPLAAPFRDEELLHRIDGTPRLILLRLREVDLGVFPVPQEAVHAGRDYEVPLLPEHLDHPLMALPLAREDFNLYESSVPEQQVSGFAPRQHLAIGQLEVGRDVRELNCAELSYLSLQLQPCKGVRHFPEADVTCPRRVESSVKTIGEGYIEDVL
mmetsp:Transcript_11382/g.25986  ORF Transcript_11382/g.25986 Transcript_11382/m.25986 type:complete len:202 (+) Transcript_11382:1848-2453(+)